MLTNLERQILDNLVAKLRIDAKLCEDANFSQYLISLTRPLELLSDPTHVYDRRERLMQLESARSLSK